MVRRISVVVLAVVALAAMALPAFAATPAEAAAAVADQGFYVEPGSSADPEAISRIVSDVRNEGENLSIVVLADEPGGGATTFADAVVDRLGDGLVLVIAPETVGLSGVGEVYTEAELEAALDAAIGAGGGDVELARTFASQLGVVVAGGPLVESGAPTTVGAPAGQGESGSGGGGGFLLFLLLVGGGVALFLWLRSRRKRTPAANDAQLAKARAAVQQQLDAVANDILDMEDEVRLADDPRADRFYQDAAETYRAASEAFPQATTPQQLLDLANQLDVAIWQLDSAEAVLDGKPLPDRPEPRRLEPVRRERVPVPDTSSGGRPQYDRRPTRRSSYGGPSIMDLLIMVGGAMMSGRRGGGLLGGGRRAPRSSGGGLGGLFGRSERRSPPPDRSSESSPIPSPSRRGSRGPAPTRRSPSSRRGTGGKRIRMGRRRRRG